jgi:hypothetical protein
MQIKTTRHTRMAESKGQIIASVCENVETMKFSQNSGENTKWCNHFKNQPGSPW